jgi:hypothetical protein
MLKEAFATNSPPASFKIDIQSQKLNLHVAGGVKVKGIPHQSLEVDEVLNLWRKLYCTGGKKPQIQFIPFSHI